MNIDFNLILKKLLPLFVIILFSYILSSFIYILLPKHEDIKYQDTKTLKYLKYDIENSFVKTNKKEQNIKIEPIEKLMDISSLTLKAIFLSKTKKSFVSIYDKTEKKYHILNINDSLQNYKLSHIYKKYVVFTKDGQSYKLTIINE
jgi:type II secretory pathway component PulC